MSRRVITFHYEVRVRAGQVLDSSAGKAPLTFLEGSGQIIPGLEQELAKMTEGQKGRIEVACAAAYGPRDESLVVRIAKKDLPVPQVKVGDRFRAGDEGGQQVFVVTAIEGDDVSLDANHPLAGQDLLFEVELVQIRPATEEEMQHGHAHSGDGHHH